MGYYTRFNLKVLKGDLDSVKEAYKKEMGFDIFEERTTMYNETTISKLISLIFPKAFLVMEGYGEENGDIWRRIYNNGEVVDEWILDSSIPPIPYEKLGINPRTT